MPNVKPENAGLRLAGDGYIQRILSGGVESPVVGPLAMEYFGAAPQVDRTTIMDRRRGRRSMPLFTTVDPKEPAGKLTLLNVPRPVLAMALLGTEVALNQASGSVAAEVHTVVPGYGMQMAYLNIGAVVVKDITDTTTFVKDTDYEELDLEEGIIRVIAGSDLASEESCHVSYDYGTVTGESLVMGTDSSVEAMVKLAGINELTGDDGYANNKRRAVAQRVLMTPTGEINLVGTEPVKAEFEIVPLTPVSGYSFTIDSPVFGAP